MLIGIVVSGVIEEYTASLCKGIEYRAAKNGDRCVVIPGKYIDFNYGNTLGNPYGYCFNSTFSYGSLSCFDGLIIEVASVSMFADDESKDAFASRFEGIPHVFISYDKDDVSSVSIDNKAGLKDALEYLYKCGTRKFAMLGGPDDNKDAKERKQAFLEFLKRHELKFEPKNYVAGKFFPHSSVEAFDLVEKNLDAEAFICANDVLATCIYEALKLHGRNPGEDASVLGFDDSNVATMLYPTLSSIRTDVVELGIKAHELLCDAVAGKKPSKKRIPSKFIRRDSFCVEESGGDESLKTLSYANIVKANVHVDKKDKNTEMEEVLGELAQYIIDCSNDKDKKITETANNLVDGIFKSKGAEDIDVNLFTMLLERLIHTHYANSSDERQKHSLSIIYMEILKRLISITNVFNKSMDLIGFENAFNSEAFFRDSMQIIRGSELNYARIFKNVSFLGMYHAFMYMYKKPISYMQGEIFEVPDKLYLKAVLKDGEYFSVPRSKQKIKSKDLFENEYVDWKNCSRLTIFPIYAEQYLYGIVLCDMDRNGYRSSELFVSQVNSVVKMMQLQIDNNKILNEYEETLRRLKENNIELDNMTKSDPLTGLNNRRGFMVRAKVLREQFPSGDMGIVVGYVDMNDLKIVNDRYGHDDGDYALRTIGSILTDFVTPYNGVAARIGGDEFTFMFVSKKDAVETMYRDELYGMFEQFNQSSTKPYDIKVSAGVYMLKDDTQEIEDALNAADELLYQEKLKKYVI